MSAKKKVGRPVTREIELDATPERVARAMFAAVKPPDPAKRIPSPKRAPTRPARARASFAYNPQQNARCRGEAPTLLPT